MCGLSDAAILYDTSAVYFGKSPKFIQQQSFTETQLDLNLTDTQLEIIKSRALAVVTINQIKLEDDQDFKSSGLLLVVA